MKLTRAIFIILIVIVLAGISYIGVKTYIRYSNPLVDVIAGYYEKTVNSTDLAIGEIIEVEVFVYWHGYVLPEFKRDVKIVDPFPEKYFAIESVSNVYESKGAGGSYLFKYSIRVLRGEDLYFELPKPRLYLDNIEIPINGTSPNLNISREGK